MRRAHPRRENIGAFVEEITRQPSGIVASILQESGIKGDHTAEAYRDALWSYILGLVRAGVEELQIDPAHPKPMEHRHMIMGKLPFDAR